MGAQTSIGCWVWLMNVSTTCGQRDACTARLVRSTGEVGGLRWEDTGVAKPQGKTREARETGWHHQQALCAPTHLAQPAIHELAGQAQVGHRILKSHVHHHEWVCLQCEARREGGRRAGRQLCW